MKYFLLFLIILSFIGTSVSDDKTTGNVLKDSVYNYITSLDNTFNYLVENVSFFSNISENSYKTSYNSIMKDRIFQEHLVQPGETLDSIIQLYNTNIDDIEAFRKVVYKENQDIVSSSYDVKAGEYILVPSNR
ncbi:MAG: LysM peptidoglycan-binding domain-containing protein [Romboutsia sp.]|nr:LysM peptidoglycan-binding domain-containing protein [Romboutsia sp.]